MSSDIGRPYDRDYNFVPNPYNQDPYSTHEYIQPNTLYEPVAEASVNKYSHVGDFTPFYIVITICSIIGLSLFILNIVLGCCSKYSAYWQDKHTGE